MRKSKFLIIALVVVLVAIICIIFCFPKQMGLNKLLSNLGIIYSYDDAEKYSGGETSIAETVENLDVDWRSGNIKIEYNSSNEIRVTETGNRAITGDDQLQWWLDGTILRIRYVKDCKYLWFDNLDKTLTISLPKGICLNQVKLHTTSGNMDIPELTVDEAELTVTSGNISAALDARRITVKATSGDLKIRQEGTTDEVKIEVTSGTITADLANAKNVRIRSTSGDITVSGKVGEADIDATSGKINARLDAFRKLKIEVTSGDVKATLPENDGGFTCAASMTSGDFNYSGFNKVSKDGKTYTFGDGKNDCTIKTTSGNIDIVSAD